MGKGGQKRGVFGAAGINAETDGAVAVPHMAYAHLLECNTVFGTLDAVIVLPAAEPVPHGVDAGIDLCGCPVGITVGGDNAAKMLEAVIFVFDGSLEPVFAVEVHHDAALVKPVLAFEPGFDCERKEFLVGFHLENRGIIVSEMIIGTLPQIRVGIGNDFDFVPGDGVRSRFSGPLQLIDVKTHSNTP